MKCPECNTEVTGGKRHCPNCGAPMPQPDKNGESGKKGTQSEPELGRGMTIFIIAGLIILAAFGACYYMIRSDAPEHFRTVIEPDTNLAEKNGPKFDTHAVDTAKRDSINKAERLEAEKLFNSIRHKNTENIEPDGVPVTEEGDGGGQQTDSEQDPAASPAGSPDINTPPASKPQIEPIETE